MVKRTAMLFAGAVLGTVVAVGTASADDAAKGEKIFKSKCRTCHVIDNGSKHKVGPDLAGVLSRGAGKADGYKYSKNLAKADFNWDEEKLDTWLTNPRKFIKGTKMTFKLRKEDDREHVIAYLMKVAK